MTTLSIVLPVHDEEAGVVAAVSRVGRGPTVREGLRPAPRERRRVG